MNEKRPFKCPYCPKTYKDLRSARIHLVIAHFTPKKVFDFADFVLESYSKDKETRIKYSVKAEIL